MKLSRESYRRLSIPLETDRFELKPLTFVSALRTTGPWRTDAEILTAFFHTPKPRSIRKWLRSGMLPNGRNRFVFAICPKATAEPIGAEIVTLTNYRSAYSAVAIHDLGWRGKNVVLETRAALINHFMGKGDLVRFFGIVEGRNLASIFNYKRLGFTHAGTWHRHIQNPGTGEIIDLVYFELMRNAWMEGQYRENAGEC